MRKASKLTAGLLLVLAGGAARAQTAAPDTAALAAGVAAATGSYTTALGTGSLLYNGPEYVDYTTPGTRGSQFLDGPTVQTGAVTYRGGQFGGLPLRYDLLLDQVVLLYPGQALTVALPSALTAGFRLGSHRFVRLGPDSLRAAGLPTGFYEVLVPGPVQLLARHTKRVERVTVQGQLTQEYKQTDVLYVRTAEATTTVGSLPDLLAALPTHRDEVQRYARQLRLRFSTDERAASAERLLRYYYTLR